MISMSDVENIKKELKGNKKLNHAELSFLKRKLKFLRRPNRGIFFSHMSKVDQREARLLEKQGLELYNQKNHFSPLVTWVLID